MARLAHLGEYMFTGSRFELIGRRDEEGIPLPPESDSTTVSPHLDEMEVLLHRTQRRLDDLRLDHHHSTLVHQALIGDTDDHRAELHVSRGRAEPWHSSCLS